MESRSYVCSRCGKSIMSTNNLTRYVNTCKILIILPSHQPSNPESVLDYNITNLLELPSDNKGENISPGASYNGKKTIRSADIDNNKEDTRQADIDKQRSATLN